MTITDQWTPQDYDEASLPVLVQSLRHAESTIRANAACALGDRLRCDEITTYTHDTRESLATLLEDPVFAVQFEAAIALAEDQDKRATITLVHALGSRQLRLDAIRALGHVSDSRAIEPLQQIMNRWLMPWADKLQAAAALTALGDQHGAQYLFRKLSSRRRDERAAAIHFMGESHHPDALKVLTRIIEDEQDPMRDVALRTIGLIPDEQAQIIYNNIIEHADKELLDLLQDEV